MANKGLNEKFFNKYNLKFPFIGKDKKPKNFSYIGKFDKIFCNPKIREVLFNKNTFFEKDNNSFHNRKSPQSSKLCIPITYQTINNFYKKTFDNSRNKTKYSLLKNSSQLYSNNKILEIKFPDSSLNKVNLKNNKFKLFKKINQYHKNIYSDRGKNKPFLKIYMNNLLFKKSKKFKYKYDFSSKSSKEKTNIYQFFTPKNQYTIFPNENITNIKTIYFKNNDDEKIQKSKSFYKVIKIKKSNNMINETPNYNTIENELFKSQIIKSRHLSQRSTNNSIKKSNTKILQISQDKKN